MVAMAVTEDMADMEVDTGKLKKFAFTKSKN
jgi:hypothetical protein